MITTETDSSFRPVSSVHGQQGRPSTSAHDLSPAAADVGGSRIGPSMMLVRSKRSCCGGAAEFYFCFIQGWGVHNGWWGVTHVLSSAGARHGRTAGRRECWGNEGGGIELPVLLRRLSQKAFRKGGCSTLRRTCAG
eukprot:scaffold7165_cov115-Isochrysis_galbana.AAC.4